MLNIIANSSQWGLGPLRPTQTRQNKEVPGSVATGNGFASFRVPEICLAGVCLLRGRTPAFFITLLKLIIGGIRLVGLID